MLLLLTFLLVYLYICIARCTCGLVWAWCKSGGRVVNYDRCHFVHALSLYPLSFCRRFFKIQCWCC